MKELLQTFFTSWFFYALYIAIMLGIFSYYSKRIFYQYKLGTSTAAEVVDQLQGLQKVSDTLSRFRSFDDWLKGRENEPYILRGIKPAWDQFYRKYMLQQQSGLVFTPDVYDFFNDDALVHKQGERKLTEIIPGIFLAMGIIGTFLGIAFGVSSLDLSGDSSLLKNGVSTLLSGMQVKFTSSIIGILLSLIWQFVDKQFFYPMLTESFYNVRKAFDETFPTQEESIVLYQMLKNQEKHIVDFQSFLSEMFLPNMVSGITKVVNETITPHMIQTQQSISEVMSTIQTNQVQSIKQNDEFQAYLSQSFMPSIVSGISDVLNQSMMANLEKTQQLVGQILLTLRSNHEADKEQNEQFKLFLTDTIGEKLTPQLEQAQQTMKEILHTISVDQLQEMNQILLTLRSNHDADKEQNEQFKLFLTDTIGEKLTPQLEQAQQTMKEILYTMSVDQLQEMNQILLTLRSNHEADKEHNEQFKRFLTDTILPSTVEGISNTFMETLTPHLEQTQQIMSDMAETMSVNQLQGMSQMVDQFVTSLNENTGDHMRELGEALEKTIEWQQRVHDGMSSLVDSMQDTARGQSEMAEKTTVLTEQMHGYTDKLTNSHDVLDQTVSRMSENAEKHAELHEATSDLLGHMVEERRVFHEFFDGHIDRLQTSLESLVTQTEQQADMQLKLADNLSGMNDVTQTQQRLSESLSSQAKLSQESNELLSSLLGKFGDTAASYVKMQEGLGSMLSSLNQERQKFDKVIGSMHQSFTQQLQQMDERLKTIQQVWGSTTDVLTKLNKQFSVSMNQFTDDMHRGLEHTFGQFDTELSKIADHLAKGAQAIQEGVIDLPEAMHNLKQTVNEFNKHVKRTANPA